jgi:hypothetical protein
MPSTLPPVTSPPPDDPAAREARLNEVRVALLTYLGMQGFGRREVVELALKLLTDVIVNSTDTELTPETVADAIESSVGKWLAIIRTPGRFYIGARQGSASRTAN